MTWAKLGKKSPKIQNLVWLDLSLEQCFYFVLFCFVLSLAKSTDLRSLISEVILLTNNLTAYLINMNLTFKATRQPCAQSGVWWVIVRVSACWFYVWLFGCKSYTYPGWCLFQYQWSITRNGCNLSAWHTGQRYDFNNMNEGSSNAKNVRVW